MNLINIAICDDMPVLRECIEMLIHEYEKENGIRFNLLHFDSGEDLIDRFEEDRTFFHLLFLDYYMKELNGIETAKHIRKHNTQCHIVFVTSSEEYYKFLEVHPLKILRKPVQQYELNWILENVLCEA